jgi:hypothetical protein
MEASMHLKVEDAWQALKNGQLEKAEQLSWELLNKGVAPSQIPLAQALTCRAFFLGRRGAAREAVALLQNILSLYPKDAYAQELMIAILRETIANRKPLHPADSAHASARTRRLVLGLGTGRCGSTTLSRLFEAQKNGCFSHECPPRLAWNHDAETIDFHLRRFRLLLELFPMVGDVSHWWLPYFRLIRQHFPEVRAVVLRRDKEETVDSFLRIKGGGQQGSINHWVEHDGKFWRKNLWDDCYPKYRADTMKEAIARYWDEYYLLAGQMEAEFPDQIRIYDIAALSDARGQQEILEFCGFAEIIIPGDIHANKGHANDGASQWPNFLDLLQ